MTTNGGSPMATTREDAKPARDDAAKQNDSAAATPPRSTSAVAPEATARAARETAGEAKPAPAAPAAKAPAKTSGPTPESKRKAARTTSSSAKRGKATRAPRAAAAPPPRGRPPGPPPRRGDPPGRRHRRLPRGGDWRACAPEPGRRRHARHARQPLHAGPAGARRASARRRAYGARLRPHQHRRRRGGPQRGAHGGRRRRGRRRPPGRLPRSGREGRPAAVVLGPRPGERRGDPHGHARVRRHGPLVPEGLARIGPRGAGSEPAARALRHVSRTYRPGAGSIGAYRRLPGRLGAFRDSPERS